ncbi:site-specific DNA-methyltransferase (adenine-specific) [Cupriavidus phytorum]|uniref:Methyltransferase n=1 Tax=Cupriavidus phytorum TaxID=3024399 RepID=A0A2W7PIM6_9BURK|nr:site-specific DNA-methyltransferase [Cupriavidus alkaliphilus]PZX32037.1 site-specific DNA-methyltransferase (adenine-specific) [Cupriavidus alkaliphilus]
MTGRFSVHCGDCREILQGLPDWSIDSIVTDPPYELGFMGKGWDSTGIANSPAIWAECLRVLKPGGHLLAFGGSRTYHRMASAIEDAGFELRDQIMWLYGSGFPKSRNLGGDWDGWGTALKPAHEPICVARKPLAGTVAANVLAHGTGALNIDACRVSTGEVLRAGTGGIPCRHDESTPRGRSGEASADHRYTDAGCTNFAMKPGPRGGDAAGRWPANVIHDGSDEVLQAFAKFGERGASAPVDGTEASVASAGRVTGKRERVAGAFHADTGTAARFFYCAKASRTDRNEGCEHMERKPLHWSSGDANPGSFQSERTDKTSQNNHPTVKPTELMAYLCRLVTPAGGLVLDPFMGSGSTGKAAMREGFRFIGIDMTPAYVEIARARISHALTMVCTQSPRQASLFEVAA